MIKRKFIRSQREEWDEKIFSSLQDKTKCKAKEKIYNLYKSELIDKDDWAGAREQLERWEKSLVICTNKGDDLFFVLSD